MGKSISAIVLNWNEAHVSVDTVHLLLKEGIKVIVIDNGSTDDSDVKFREFGNDITYVRLNNNYGSSIARNIGINLIENSDYTFLIDGDILYVPNTISTYSKILDSYPFCACVGYFDWEHRQKTGWAHGTKDKDLADIKIAPIINIVGNWYPMAWTQYGLFRTFVLKKYKFISIAPFNSPGYGFEDDWLYRDFKKDGWESFHVNHPFYYHDAHFSIRELKKQQISNKIEERKKIYYQKWGTGTLSGDIINGLPKTYFSYKDSPITVDLIMLAYTKNEEMYKMTNNAISSLFTSEVNIKFNVYLIETNKNLHSEFPNAYSNVHVIIPNDEFNFNKFVNIGLTKCFSNYVVISNNDVIFEKYWMSNAINTMESKNIDSASPYSEDWFIKGRCDIPQDDVSEGYEIGKQLFGYCIIARKKVFDKIGKYDENFEFWYQDNDYAEQLKKNNLRHALIKKSVVHHLMSKSHDLISQDKKEHFTNGMYKVYKEKYRE